MTDKKTKMFVEDLDDWVEENVEWTIILHEGQRYYRHRKGIISVNKLIEFLKSLIVT